MQSLLGDRLERGAARGGTHLTLQAEPFGDQRVTALLELAELGGGGDSPRAAENDA